MEPTSFKANEEIDNMIERLRIKMKMSRGDLIREAIERYIKTDICLDGRGEGQKSISFRIPKELLEEVDRKAEKCRQSRSEVYRASILFLKSELEREGRGNVLCREI